MLFLKKVLVFLDSAPTYFYINIQTWGKSVSCLKKVPCAPFFNVWRTAHFKHCEIKKLIKVVIITLL